MAKGRDQREEWDAEASNPAPLCIVHAADLHLGARRWLCTGKEHSELSEHLRLADRLAFRALIDLCLTERAQLLLCAGDLFDGWCRDYMVAIHFTEELLRLRDADCQVVLLLGNHDLRSRLLHSLPLPGFVRLLGLGEPETVTFDRLGVAVHGWSAPDVAPGTDVSQHYPTPVPGCFNIGLLHTSAEGRKGHVEYAPCSRRSLRRHGYDYWALGHVHAREVIATAPWIVFPGNLQARGPRESGPKGATLVQVASSGVVRLEHRPVDALRFETTVADTAAVSNFDDVLDIARTSLANLKPLGSGPPTVATLALIGVAGAASCLTVPSAARQRALTALSHEFAERGLWLHEVRVDTGTPLGGFNLPILPA